MATQRVSVVKIAGKASIVALRKVFKHIRKLPEETQHKALTTALDFIREQSIYPPVCYHREYVDSWSMFIDFQMKNYTPTLTLESKNITVHCYEKFQKAHDFALDLKTSLRKKSLNFERRMFYTALLEAFNKWTGIHPSVLLIVRHVETSTWLDDEILNLIAKTPLQAKGCSLTIRPSKTPRPKRITGSSLKFGCEIKYRVCY